MQPQVFHARIYRTPARAHQVLILLLVLELQGSHLRVQCDLVAGEAVDAGLEVGARLLRGARGAGQQPLLQPLPLEPHIGQPRPQLALLPLRLLPAHAGMHANSTSATPQGVARTQQAAAMLAGT